MPVAELRAHAPAKVNLVLEVLGTRPDGYHDVDTVLQALELADDLTLVERAATPVVVEGPFAAGTPADGTNLAWRALVQLAAAAGESPDGLGVRLVKNIPAAGGLGGGASDAAAMLRLLARRWPHVTPAQLLDIAASLGSDVPFFLHGGTQRGQGRGERLTPLPPLPRHAIVLFVPPETLDRKTPRLFAAIDSTGFDDGSVARAFVAHPPAVFEAASVFNAFERVAFDLFPGLADLAGDLEARIAQRVRLAGAGPTLFWIGDPADAAAIVEVARGTRCDVLLTATAEAAWAR